jgi:sugar phosphate isomerase/epimerase
MHELGIERLSVFGMPPPAFVRLAAGLDCRWVGLGLSRSSPYNPEGYPDWSLRDDAALRAELRQAVRETGVGISLIEGFAVVPERNIRDYEADLDIVAELGCARIAAVSVDKDLQRTIDGMAELARMAAERELLVSAELGSLGPIPTVAAALALVRGVDAANFSLLFDTMHYFRLGNTIAQLAEIASQEIGYVQLCDAPWTARFDTYMEEAMYERLAPGDGELPLQAFLDRLPPGVIVSLEIPMRALADQGMSPRDRLAPCVAAARAMLARAAAHTPAAGR